MTSPPTPLSEYSETERQIFDAALHVFAREGRHGARMQAIADAADINKAMLHYYFEDKETLYEEVFTYTVERFMASFGASLREASTFENTLRAFIDGYIEFVRSDEAAMRLMIQENLAGGDLLGAHLREATNAGDAPPQILVETIASAVDAGEIRAVDPQHTVLSVVSSCLFFFVARPTVQIMHPAAEDDWGAFVEARKDHLFDLIYHGLAPRAGRGSTPRGAREIN
ncbi:TetR/AcrR family transcriptional regulator [Salinibacter altiplanensis]|uniref:TetR/AcrR family transcriptional regulator n=1 Tax=Salinibacter altiplanensis TaxID=1803181 RepID=UPI001F3A61C5|nr:TetR family transcriptional regulator [Salinibacter altiplanensis]